MKKNFLMSLRFTVITMVIFGLVYPLLITAIGYFTPGQGQGNLLLDSHGRVVGFELIGQRFVSDRYFHPRPSAVDYNAAATGGSNKSTTNPEYISLVRDRVTDVLATNPAVQLSSIPVELVTASGGGLDPDISPAAASVQVDRVAKARGLDSARVRELVEEQIQPPMWGIFGTSTVNVLKLNLALDRLTQL